MHRRGRALWENFINGVSSGLRKVEPGDRLGYVADIRTTVTPRILSPIQVYSFPDYSIIEYRFMLIVCAKERGSDETTAFPP
jgi:hypothetical protein